MIAFMLFQEIWVNRRLYKKYLSKEPDMGDGEYKFAMIFTLVFMLVLLYPLISVIIKIISNY
jgi:hypothetical protein